MRKLVNKRDLISKDADRALSKFARDMAAEEFGGRFWGWRRWRDFRDVSPAEISSQRHVAERRARAICYQL